MKVFILISSSRTESENGIKEEHDMVEKIWQSKRSDNEDYHNEQRRPPH